MARRRESEGIAGGGAAGLAPRPAAPGGPAETLLRRALLVTAIGLSCLLGYFTTYALLLLCLAVAAYFGARRASIRVGFDLPAKLFLAAFALLLVSAVATARQPADLLQLLDFSAMLFYAPLAALFRRAAGPANGRKTADFALAGVAVGLCLSLWFTYVDGAPRAGIDSYFTDPIRLSNTALLLGFLAMIGAAGHAGQHRFIYFLGPLLALAVIFSTGSRAALIAFAVLLLVAALLLVRRRLLALSVGLGTIAAFGTLAYVADLAGARSSSLFEIAGRLAGGDNPADLGTTIRFILYRAGAAAFLDAPVFGHGWTRLMSSITPYLVVYEQVHAQLPHLHKRRTELRRRQRSVRHRRLPAAAGDAGRRLPRQPARQPVPHPALWLFPAGGELFRARPARYHAELSAAQHALRRADGIAARVLPRRAPRLNPRLSGPAAPSASRHRVRAAPRCCRNPPSVRSGRSAVPRPCPWPR